MPLDLSNPQGFNKWWTDTVEQFRREAVGLYPGDDPSNWDIPTNLVDSQGDPVLQNHIKGPVTADQLASQRAYPIVWTVPQNHSPAYATVSTDQGTLQMQVVFFVADADPEAAFDKARALGGRAVNNVEGSALVDDTGTAHASEVQVQNFQMDFEASPGESRAQVRTSQVIFSIEVERRYS